MCYTEVLSNIVELLNHEQGVYSPWHTDEFRTFGRTLLKWKTEAQTQGKKKKSCFTFVQNKSHADLPGKEPGPS